MMGAQAASPAVSKPVSHLKVVCPTCGQPLGRDCIDLTVGLQSSVRRLDYAGHIARRAKAQQLYGDETR